MNKICLLIVLVLSTYSCTKQKDSTVLEFPSGNSKFEDLFKVEKTIKIKMNNSDSTKLFSVYKIHKIDSNRYFIIDAMGRSSYIIDSTGLITKRISRQGQGPGELNYVTDYTFDERSNLYLLDPIANKISTYDSSFNFIKSYQLSFEHRISYELRYCNGFFFISSVRNLDKNSNSKNFSFLEYDENTFVMVYDRNFTLINSFLKPAKELKETQGVLTLSKENTAPYTIYDNKVFVMTQEGFYTISLFDMNFNMREKFEVINSKFKKIDINKVKNIKIANNKLITSVEEIGRIVSSYTTPVSLDIINDRLIVTMLEPYGNYYPKFDKDIIKKFYYDIFKIKDDNIIPQFSNIETSKRIIGIENNHIYLTEDFGKNSNDYISIEIAKLLK